ncbi:hypothetical protein L207DRAFT_514305 [Hyaloscypha variabilis F]|uniref:Uncharacterized protein n=1 Tax=Hyaloscypha variabilis (strain UAMH 11265 / GT02V1 / F) TaxID=1149755 RepID=A0A2J6RIT1_HYAVF|nr:hypothetical protein L207DRAFT_514305 [Hyaloscypha variabilis F]
MELPAGLNRRYACLAGFWLLAIWCWVAFDRPYAFPNHVPWNVYSGTPQAQPALDVFDYPPLDSSALKHVCSKTQWNQSVTFICDDSSGGVAEVRNSILNCVRYTIAAGGSLVVPRITVRKEYEDFFGSNTTELDYMFDTNHFINSIMASCPQMRVYKAASTITNRQYAYGPISLVPESLVKKISTGVRWAEEWRGLFYKWLLQYVAEDNKGPIIVRLGRSFLEYPIYDDDDYFVLQFGKMLKVRQDIRVLATTTLRTLSDIYNLPFRLSEPVTKKAFLGVYLSTDDRGLTKTDTRLALYKVQSQLYLAQASSSNLSLIYAASEFGHNIVDFIKDGSLQNITAIGKLDLLRGQDREHLLDAFRPDQQALVDFLVLSKASEFAGVGHSNFAWNLALARHFYTAQKDDELDGPQMYADAISRIYGAPGGHPEFPASMWP